MFNIFKHKTVPSPPTARKPQTILCIPGDWNNRSEIVTAIAESNLNEFIFAGAILYNMQTKKGFTLEICERDERMKESFKWAGMVNRVSEDFLNAVDQHKFVIYLSGETGDTESATAIATAGNAILKAGGTGIKIESTGKAFTKAHWSELVNTFEEASLYQMYVLDSINNGKGATYSCGMHNLGLRDCIVYNEEFQDAVQLISIFGYYQLMEKPVIRNGQTFSANADAPVFIIRDEGNQPYKGDELFENPFGMWRLERKV